MGGSSQSETSSVNLHRELPKATPTKESYLGQLRLGPWHSVIGKMGGFPSPDFRGGCRTVRCRPTDAKAPSYSPLGAWVPSEVHVRARLPPGNNKANSNCRLASHFESGCRSPLDGAQGSNGGAVTSLRVAAVDWPKSPRPFSTEGIHSHCANTHR